jgi:hypothetical protein
MDTQLPSDEHLQNAMGQVLWGDLYSSTYQGPVSVSIYSQPVLFDRQRRIGIIIRVQRHFRQWAGKTVAVREKDVVTEFTINERDIYMMSVLEAIAAEFKKTLAAFPKEVAPRLYEADPRIGTVVEIGYPTTNEDGMAIPGEKFSACPLFDPPGGVYLPYTKPPIEFPLADQLYKRWTRCGQCKEPFVPGDKAVWGGGYLLWACEKCVSHGPNTTRVPR